MNIRKPATALRCLFGALSVLGCNGFGRSDPTVGTESHFLTYCDSACPDAMQCLCGVCSKGCASATDCQALQPNASCIETAPRVAEGRCANTSPPTFCDVQCIADSDCEGFGQNYGCQVGYC